jgi:hypothetical protein
MRVANYTRQCTRKQTRRHTRTSTLENKNIITCKLISDNQRAYIQGKEDLKPRLKLKSLTDFKKVNGTLVILQSIYMYY